MGIQFAVHTYGHYDAMFYVLNGIKMIMNSDFAGAMINLMALIATSYYSLRGMAEAAQGGVGHYLLKTISMLMLISALLMPKADIWVIDRISGKREVVSGLPYAFVLPVGTLEAVGAGITSLFEQAFARVNSMAYKDYGLIFGQRLVQESKNWRISDPEFARNMNVFLKRCVVLEAMIGTRFTPEDVFKSTDILGLVTESAGTFRQVDFQINKRIERLNCKEAGDALKQYLRPEIDSLHAKYLNSDFAIAGGGGDRFGMQLNQLLNRNLEIGYATSLGVGASAAEIIRQNMMINALKDGGNISDKYGYTRADDLQKSNWKISGELAKEYLPLLLNIMKSLIYASFIFVVPLMILSGGVTHYLKYCTVVFSLQIWPALNAVLNLFIELYSNLRGSALTGGDLTFANFNQVHESIDTIVLVASGLQISIPFLSFAIVQGGVGSLINLASNLQSASMSAANIASGEVTSGNRSFDNISHDTASIGNKSGFKTDFNQLHQEGAMQIQGADGSVIRTFADGASSISSGAGINTSSGTRALSLENSKNAAKHEGMNESISAMRSDEQHYQNAQSSGISTTTDRIAHLAQRLADGKSVNIDTTTEEGKVMQQALNHTKSLHDRDGYGWRQSAAATVKAYADVGIKLPGGVPFVKSSAGVSIDGSVSAENNSNQSLEKDTSTTRENNTSKSLNTLLRAASNQHYTQDDSIDQSLAKSTKASYDEMQSYGESISRRKEEVDNYNRALQYSASQGGSDKRDMYHELEQNVMKQYGVSQQEAHKMVESYDPRANKVWDSMVQREVAQDLAKVQAAKGNVINTAKQDKEAFNNEYSGKVNDQGQTDLQQKAAKEGLDFDLMNNNIQRTKGRLEDKQQDMTKNVKEQIHAVEHHNNVMERGMDGKIQEYEKDRIGQGKTSKVLGALARIPTLGNSGDLHLGGMALAQKAKEYLKGNDKASQVAVPPVKSSKPQEKK